MSRRRFIPKLRHEEDIGPVAREQRRARLRLLWEEQHGLCWYCKEFTVSTKSTIDHVVPQSKGGTDAYDNVVMACRPCNTRKADRTTQRLKTPGRLVALVALRPEGP